jgi:hypothetical protein
LINERIYVLGDFRTLGGGSVDLDSMRDFNDLLSEWKKDQPTLLKRFDLDQDGKLNEKEWELACQAGRQEVARMRHEARNRSDVHTLRCPRDGRPYQLSNIDPKQRARRYLLWSMFHLVFFLVMLGAIPWVMDRYS